MIADYGMGSELAYATIDELPTAESVTDDELLDLMLYRCLSRIDISGGYPDDGRLLDRWIIIATLKGDAEPLLEVWKTSDVRKAYAEALEVIRSDQDIDSIVDALNECLHYGKERR